MAKRGGKLTSTLPNYKKPKKRGLNTGDIDAHKEALALQTCSDEATLSKKHPPPQEWRMK